MDRNTFDTLARGVGRSTNRRAALAALGLGLLGAGSVLDTATAKKRKKNKGKEKEDDFQALCCQYNCGPNPDFDPTGFKFYCGGRSGVNRCAYSYEGCQFGRAFSVDKCSQCGQ